MDTSFTTLLTKPLLGIVASLFLTLPCFAAQRIFEDTVEVDEDVNFSIKSHRGKVRIATGNVNTIEIKAIMTHDYEEALDNVEVNVFQSRSRVSVDVDYHQHGFNIGSWFSPNQYTYPHIQFEIVIPDQASLKINSHRSDLEVEAPSGRLRISAHRGQGRISNIREDLSLDTHRGEFFLEIVRLSDVRIDTHRGDVDMEIHDASNFAIDASAHRGKFRVSGRDIPKHRHDREDYIDYKEGNGDNLIKIDSHRADIDIDFRD